MRQCIKHQIDNVLVGQCVVDVFSVAAPHNQIFATQNPEPLRNGGHVVIFGQSQFGDTSFALRQQREQPQTRWFAQSAEQPGCGFNRRRVDGR